MKDSRIILLVSLLFTCSFLSAQQLPVYTNYIFKGTLYNPALVGTEGDVELSLNFKKHYNRISGGPITGWAGFDMPIRKEDIGIGAQFYVDKAGAKNNVGGSVSYAYHIPFTKEYDHKLSIGLSAGFFHQGFNFDELVAVDDGDPDVNTGGATAFDMAVGINYRFKGLNIGFSVPQVIDSKLRFREGGNPDQETSQSHLRRHYFVTAGYEAAMGKEKKFFLTPSIAMRKVKGLPVQFDGNLIFDFDHMVWFGVSYKTANVFKNTASLSPIIGFNIKERIDITYSFDTDVNGTENTNLGYGHEILTTC